MTWAKVLKTVPANPFGSGLDEQALTDAFEGFVGGPSQGFRLMRLHTAVQRQGKPFYGKLAPLRQRFIEAAKRDGFTEEQAKAYLSVA